ncbi:Abi family protein [Empedobacter sp. UBA7248]|uniref:Abi family protein n=1 Tax=Empedobacter sp. UBA7248 TaxID=1946448 RepID=UPI0025C379A9|nr:Abi family protein [Empedobacter sp. UBA7248]
MGLIATTIEEQIQKLLDRGMIIEDVDKAKEILLDIGYYRLGFYWHHFEIDGDHNFQENLNFMDVVDLYYLDVDLKYILSKAILRIEVNFRTKLLYHGSINYKNNNSWYINKKYINSDILSNLTKIYSKLKDRKTLTHHHTKYKCKHAPAWKVFEFLTFGQIMKIYNNIIEEDLKNEIANQYKIKDYVLLENYFISIINIRNICFHHSILYDYNQPIGINKIRSKKYKFITRNATNLNASIKLILFILSRISEDRAAELELEIRTKIDNSRNNKLLNEIINTHICFDL